ncbi:hypothetical protein RIF29_28985 [Crotalaria pallida]|uniref:Uncharacterized protein n=1 Tax=Crotalaria pallida TaxID=3830 RepID=A0AAN9EDP2_CROPI
MWLLHNVHGIDFDGRKGYNTLNEINRRTDHVDAATGIEPRHDLTEPSSLPSFSSAVTPSHSHPLPPFSSDLWLTLGAGILSFLEVMLFLYAILVASKCPRSISHSDFKLFDESCLWRQERDTVANGLIALHSVVELLDVTHAWYVTNVPISARNILEDPELKTAVKAFR